MADNCTVSAGFGRAGQLAMGVLDAEDALDETTDELLLDGVIEELTLLDELTALDALLAITLLELADE